MTVSATINVGLSISDTNTGDLVTAQAPLSYKKTFTFTNGAGANQASAMWSDTRTAAGNDDIDLAGVLTNHFGNTVTFARVKAIMVFARTAAVAIGGAAANQFVNWVANSSDIVNIPVGGMMLLVAPDAAGYAVTATTADILRINCTGDYDIVILGSVT